MGPKARGGGATGGSDFRPVRAGLEEEQGPAPMPIRRPRAAAARWSHGTPHRHHVHSVRLAGHPPGRPPARPGSLVRAGGVAAQVVAGTYVVGFGAMAAYLVPAGFVDTVTDPAGSLAFLVDHQPAMRLWYVVLYLVGGTAMALVALGVGDRLRAAAPARPASRRPSGCSGPGCSSRAAPSPSSASTPRRCSR